MMSELNAELAQYYDRFIVFLPRLVFAVVICFTLLFVLRSVRRRMVNLVRGKVKDQLLLSFGDNVIMIINGVFISLLFLYIIGLGGIASSILGAAGVSAFVIGFALKDIGENFLAGVVMAFDRPFRMGDVIKTGDVEGVITEMSLRDTHLKTFDGKDVYVPNGQIIKTPLYNYTIDGFMRGSFTVGVDYSTDIHRAREVILNTVKTIPGVLSEEKSPRTHVKNLNTSTVDIEVHYWINTSDKNYSSLEIKSQAQSEVVLALQKENIHVPTSIIEFKNYSGSPLHDNEAS